MLRAPRYCALSFTGLFACVAATSTSTANPNAGHYDDYYTERAPTQGGAATPSSAQGGAQPQPREVTGAKTAAPRRGKIIAKKPPVGNGGKKPRPRTPVVRPEGMTYAGVVPTIAGRGSLVEIYGAGFGTGPTDVQVLIGGKAQRVVDVTEDRVVITVGADAHGQIRVIRMRRAGKNLVPGQLAVGDTPFHALPAGSNFGSARTHLGQGLLANVYALPKAVTELPAFDTLGAPIGTYAVDNLDVKSGQFDDGFVGADGKHHQRFALHFRGSLNVTEPGSYEFCLASGDGSQLYLDENLIVSNDGVHETKKACETLEIEPGEFAFDLLYFQAGAGEAGLTLTWAKDGGAAVVISPQNLFPPEDLADLARK